MTLPTSDRSIHLLTLAYFIAVGGAIGGITFGLKALHNHVANHSFEMAYVPDYLFRQFFAAVLALLVIALARGGTLTIFGARATSGVETVAAKLSGLGLGFLIGFASRDVVDYLTRLAKQTFHPCGDLAMDSHSGQRHKVGDGSASGS